MAGPLSLRRIAYGVPVAGRDAFLERLRSRLAGGIPSPTFRPIAPLEEVPPVRYEQDLADVVGAFVRNASAQGAEVRAGARLEQVLAEAVAAVGARTAVVSADDEVAGAAEVLRGLGVAALSFDGPRPEADLGVVGAAWGIAATGTVVFEAGRAGGRSASLLPPAIVAFVRAERVLRDSGDLFRRIDERFPDGLPSQMVLCTGPSKSGDIELELTTGVHGPGRVWIALVH